MIRNNSIARNDANYLTFANNSLFVTSNLIGELILNHPDLNQSMRMEDEVKRFCNMYGEWIAQRITEGVMMAATGGSQEEGFFAQLRKIYMILLCVKRGEVAGCWDYKNLCVKTNECLIDRPLCMHYAHTLMTILRSWNDQEKAFSNKVLKD